MLLLENMDRKWKYITFREVGEARRIFLQTAMEAEKSSNKKSDSNRDKKMTRKEVKSTYVCPYPQIHQFFWKSWNNNILCLWRQILEKKKKVKEIIKAVVSQKDPFSSFPAFRHYKNKGSDFYLFCTHYCILLVWWFC